LQQTQKPLARSFVARSAAKLLKFLAFDNSTPPPGLEI
jgi:hypothetical protein